MKRWVVGWGGVCIAAAAWGEASGPAPEAIAEAVRALGSSDFELRRAAQDRLLDWGLQDPDAILASLPADDSDPEVRSVCDTLRLTLGIRIPRRNALRLAETDPELKSLVELLYDVGPTAEEIQKMALSRRRSETARILAEWLECDPRRPVRIQWAALRTLAALGERSVAPQVAGLLEHESPQVCRMAALALGDLGDRSAAPRVATLLSRWRDADPGVRITVAMALGKLGEPSVIPDLAPLLKESDPGVRAAAALAMGQLAGNEWGRADPIGAASAWWEAHREDPGLRRRAGSPD